MAKKISLSTDHKALIRRYLLWAFKTTKESFERIERKTTQLIVDEYILRKLKDDKKSSGSSKAYEDIIKEFEAYIQNKRADALKLKFSVDGQWLHPQYLYLKNRLTAIEAAIKHFLGEKEWRRMHALYDQEFTTRILQAREHT